jgi:hypothetical protein
MNQLLGNASGVNMKEQYNIQSVAPAEKVNEEVIPKRSNDEPAGPVEEAEQDAKDPTHEKEVKPDEMSPDAKNFLGESD